MGRHSLAGHSSRKMPWLAPTPMSWFSAILIPAIAMRPLLDAGSYTGIAGMGIALVAALSLVFRPPLLREATSRICNVREGLFHDNDR